MDRVDKISIVYEAMIDPDRSEDWDDDIKEGPSSVEEVALSLGVDLSVPETLVIYEMLAKYVRGKVGKYKFGAKPADKPVKEKSWTFKIPEDKAQLVEKYCSQNDINRSQLLRSLVNKFLETL